ncbi:DNA adenine methylase [Halalkalibacter alkaliphilus]|uniref:DNA adenine methylase n=1 Tax=Halalkalibacter alkaliphilus TaxID=2917993 RepID=A0A9X2CV07_9BACI|nr:DNA adenine methylase [Halalkalibacter alkaliphilus]MCL7748767.1 DNA adenine methylase [Halalkalibacter alkaliphilus]
MVPQVRTKEILKQFNLSRQTLYNWVKDGDITEPEKDWRGWRMWTKQHVEEITNTIRKKEEQFTLPIDCDQRLNIKNRRYLGSKYKLLEFIWKVVNENCKGVNTVADIFGGTGVVADRFNIEGKNIIVNDILYSNHLAYWTWFSDEPIDFNKVEGLITQFNNSNPLEKNYVSEHFGGTYFTEYNARKIGYIREEIEKLTNHINFREKAILITSLLYAMDKVANTVGHYDAYRRKLDSLKEIKLLVPEFKDSNNKGNCIFNEDANELVRRISADLTYIDTPYNSRQYGDAYHLLENIAEWKKPEVSGVAKKMINRSHIKSDYCTMKATKAFEDLISNISGKYILVSYNNMAQKGVGRSNAKISAEEIVEILKMKGKVSIFDTDFQAYTTGKTNIEDHKEILYLCEISR